MALRSPFFGAVLSHSGRDQLLMDCPALQLLCYQHVVAALTVSNGELTDPLGRRRASCDGVTDGVGELLAMRSVSQVVNRVFSATKHESGSDNDPFWDAMRITLEAAFTPALPASKEDGVSTTVLLSSVEGTPHFVFATGTPGLPLLSGSLHNAAENSKRFLRSVSTCALSASIATLKEKQQLALGSVIQLSRLVPPPSAEGQVTREGLCFCMMSLPQQWWVMVCGALDRVMALTQHQPEQIPLPRLWQLMAVLAVLDTTAYMYAFPAKESDPAGYHLIARLSEVGLAYLVKTAEGQLCFVVSPHYHHALEWQSTTPVCASSTLVSAGTDATTGGCRREDTDTIITETNFRLYAYTRNEDLLRILDQFAEREERVDNVLACYRLTRDSFVTALHKGISAAKILEFLSLRAHPSMLRKYGEDAHAHAGLVGGQSSAPAATSSSSLHSGGGGGGVTPPASTSVLAIPQSVCDQLFMWESECNRVVFTKHVVLLRNLTEAQQQELVGYLESMGLSDTVVYQEPGHVVVREEAYDRFLAGSIPEDNSRSPTSAAAAP